MQTKTNLAVLGVCLCLALYGCRSGSTGEGDAVIGENAGNPGGDNMRTNGVNTPPTGRSGAKTRYELNNQCFAIQSNDSGQFVTQDGAGYAANSADIANAEPFFMRPSALGKYLIYNSAGQLLSATESGVSNVALASAVDGSEWTLTGVGDSTNYPQTPIVDEEPTPEFIAAYRGFDDPNTKYKNFTLFSQSNGATLAVNDAGMLTTVAPGSNGTAEGFSFEPATGCAIFPEAQSNVVGTTFSGTQPNGNVLGMADVHVHISATTFLGGAQWGYPFHRFGVEHAMGDCAVEHGPNGTLDAVGSLFTGDTDGHATDGWPTFSEWPARDQLTHEAIYWKWLERGWASGLRVVVNDLVDNETLCELQRNISDTDGSISSGEDCNPMNNATDQVGTMFAMQDYIDAQYGGRGEGWLRIVFDPTEARRVIENGKLAMVLGIEISNLFDCKLTYNPERLLDPTASQLDAEELNSYGCTMEEGRPNSILTQLDRLHDIGVRQIITIHEFDNAFGGNGIFDDLVLNAGNRENTGGIPSGDLAGITSLLGSGTRLNDPSNPEADDLIVLTPESTDNLTDSLGSLASDGPETPTGEFWTTYDCPVEGETEGFSGYLFGDSGGSNLQGLNPPLCTFLGQGGRPGGPSLCYPAQNQCNARWLTPIGLYTYSKLMERGMIFDIDHLELEMKTQALELAEAQPIAYPFVSTHGTFGGTSNDQARRILRNGGLIYPSLGNGPQHISRMEELRGVYQQAVQDLPKNQRPVFGFGFGTDTNGLSSQSPPRGDIAPGREVVYPYRLFEGDVFNQLTQFNNIAAVTFEQPRTTAPDGRGRTWSLDVDGSAHYGMLSGLVQEMRLEGSAQDMHDLFNSAEAYLRTWERTLAASAAINNNPDGVVVPAGLLREAPKP